MRLEFHLPPAWDSAPRRRGSQYETYGSADVIHVTVNLSARPAGGSTWGRGHQRAELSRVRVVCAARLAACGSAGPREVAGRVRNSKLDAAVGYFEADVPRTRCQRFRSRGAITVLRCQ
jgi:hypothetical protein